MTNSNQLLPPARSAARPIFAALPAQPARLAGRVPGSLAVVAALLATSFLAALAPNGVAAADPDGFVRLFDGKTFDGWEGNLKHFRIEGGAIVAGSLKEKIPNNEFLCTKQRYGDFELRLKAKLTGRGDNAGVQFRSERIPNHHEVIGFQCDIGKMGAKPIWGWLYDESRRRKFLVEADADKLTKALKADDWNDLTIRCEGSRIQIWVNGLQTVDYQETDDKIARTGIIGLQIHGGAPAEASYKDVMIKVLGK